MEYYEWVSYSARPMAVEKLSRCRLKVKNRATWDMKIEGGLGGWLLGIREERGQEVEISDKGVDKKNMGIVQYWRSGKIDENIEKECKGLEGLNENRRLIIGPDYLFLFDPTDPITCVALESGSLCAPFGKEDLLLCRELLHFTGEGNKEGFKKTFPKVMEKIIKDGFLAFGEILENPHWPWLRRHCWRIIGGQKLFFDHLYRTLKSLGKGDAPGLTTGIWESNLRCLEKLFRLATFLTSTTPVNLLTVRQQCLPNEVEMRDVGGNIKMALSIFANDRVMDDLYPKIRATIKACEKLVKHSKEKSLSADQLTSQPFWTRGDYNLWSHKLILKRLEEWIGLRGYSLKPRSLQIAAVNIGKNKEAKSWQLKGGQTIEITKEHIRVENSQKKAVQIDIRVDLRKCVGSNKVIYLVGDKVDKKTTRQIWEVNLVTMEGLMIMECPVEYSSEGKVAIDRKHLAACLGIGEAFRFQLWCHKGSRVFELSPENVEFPTIDALPGDHWCNIHYHLQSLSICNEKYIFLSTYRPEGIQVIGVYKINSAGLELSTSWHGKVPGGEADIRSLHFLVQSTRPPIFVSITPTPTYLTLAYLNGQLLQVGTRAYSSTLPVLTPPTKDFLTGSELISSVVCPRSYKGKVLVIGREGRSVVQIEVIV